MKKLLYIILFVPFALFGQVVGELYEGGYLIDVDSLNQTALIAALDDSPVLSWDGSNEYCSQLPDGPWHMPSWEELETMFYAIGQSNLINIDRWSSTLVSEAQEDTEFYDEYWFGNMIPGYHLYMWNTTTNEMGFYGNDPDNASGNVVRPVKVVELNILGCTDESALNFNVSANVDDGSCVPVIYGCMDVTAFNYNPSANINDGSCYPVIYGCLDPDAFNFNDYDYDFAGNELTGINGIDVNTHNGMCIPVDNGCIDVNAYNFDQTANTDDGSCEYLGCMNSNAINFDETATIDDEQSCIYSQDYVHGLWNEVDDGAIEYEYLQDEYNTLNTNLNNTIDEATTSISSLQQALETWNTTIDLSVGWNMFGYGCPASIDVADGLSNHTESIIITKDNNGNVYMPEFGFNGIGDFTPGFGYQIKITEAIEGFSLCDWYVNDIPEDNIISLQDSIINMHSTNCINDGYCGFDNANQICIAPEQGFDCFGNQILYQVGDLAKGGIVFYVDETGQHGLVASMEDLEGKYIWGCMDTLISGADGQAIGTGYQNTLDIVADCSQTPIAASEALAYESDGYSDWYLPSKNELHEMCNSISSFGYLGNIGNFDTIFPHYWCSSEESFTKSWTVNFIYGNWNFDYKYWEAKVRPIRSF